MSNNEDIPLVEDLEQSEEVRSLLRAGMDDDLAGYDFDKGLATHVAAVAALQAAAAATAAKAAMSSKLLAAWVAVPLASVTVLGTLWFGGAFGGSSEATEKATPRAATKTADSSSAVVTETPAPKVEAAPVAPIVAKTAVESATEVQVQAAEVAAPKHVRTEARSHSRMERAAKVEASPRATSAVEPITTVDANNAQPAAPEPVEVAPTRAELEQAAREEAAALEAARAAQEEARRVADERLKREMALLMQAKQALASDPSRALTLAMAGEQQFRGDSMFREERQHVLVLALIKLGRVDEAEQRAQPFLRAHPDSPFARRIRNALEAAR